jgi:[acyl-carrier-protein] S-malonyltransferase
MARDLVERDPGALSAVGEAEAILDLPLQRLMLEGPEAALRRTENAQPAIVLHSLLLLRRLAGAGVQPYAVAGHSVGEFSALYAAQALDWAGTLKAVAARGRVMGAAALGGTGMAAVLGLPDDRVEGVLAETAGSPAVVAANYNAPGQVVISGTEEGLERVIPALLQAGARRVVRLEVSGAFHSPLMADAARAFMPAWEAIPLRRPACVQVFNADARAHQDPVEIRELMVRQLTGPVRWTGCVNHLWELGVRTFLEVGPGRTLTGLVRKIQPQASTHNVEDLRSLDSFLETVHA